MRDLKKFHQLLRKSTLVSFPAWFYSVCPCSTPFCGSPVPSGKSWAFRSSVVPGGFISSPLFPKELWEVGFWGQSKGREPCVNFEDSRVARP